jgi:putative nucleotidyltransferase with HDIG domain
MTVVAGSVAIGAGCAAVADHPQLHAWLLLAAITVVSGTATLRIYSANVSISVSEVFVFAALVLFGAPAATLTVALDALVICTRLVLGGSGKISRSIFMFNVAAPSLAFFTAAAMFYGFGWSGPSGPLLDRLARLCATTAAYFVLGSGLIAGLTALQQRRRLIDVWWRTVSGAWPSYAAGTYAAGLLALYGRELDWRILVSILPLPVILYYAFRMSLGRVDDQIRHLAETNESYERMIAALAHAIDARDQTTHGHILRVQVEGQRLARALGVTDADELRAIHAAGLLHDLGKIAVPDEILNKPGPLNGAEYERMKQHATAGADILSEVHFPYALVPIVRHHHENWDGSGYPAGLRGDQIPLGARILSVVDCYDALTSVRPYRRALTADAALRIIVDRRGTYYDPAVVDAFVRCHAKDASAAEPAA